jgi:hypothetical protein
MSLDSVRSHFDLSVASAGAVRDEPYRWAVLPGLADPGFMTTLAGREHGGDKTYRMNVLPIVRRDAPLPAAGELDPVWLDLAGFFGSPAYRNAMSEVAGQDLSRAPMDVGFFRFHVGHAISPHTDHREKILTQIYYFHESWESEWGGCLRILRTRSAEDVYAEILPLVQYSAVIVRSDRSWHMVTSGTPSMPGPRQTLQVEFWGD